MNSHVTFSFLKVFIAIVFSTIVFCGTGIAQCPDNLLTNPGFENDLQGWSTTGNITITSDAHTGSSAVEACGPPASISQVYPAIVGQEYTGSVWGKGTLDPSNPVAPYIWLRFLRADYSPIINPPVTLPERRSFFDADYTLKEVIGVAPPDAVYAHLLIWKEEGSCFTVDDLELCEGAGAGGNKPDLFAKDFTITSNVLDPISGDTEIGSTFDLTNQGTGTTADNFYVQYYLSTDELRSADDLQMLEVIFTDPIVPGGSLPQQNLFNVPSTFAPPGNYFMIVCVDDDDDIDESNEVNNCRFSVVEIFEPNFTCNISASVNNLLCNDNGTPNDPDDDTFTADITVTNPTGGTGFVPGGVVPCLIESGDYGVTYTFGPANTLGFGNNCGNSVVIADIDDPTCKTVYSIFPPPNCSNGSLSPDLIIANGNLSPNPVVLNGQVNFSLDIENIGTAAVNDHVNIQIFSGLGELGITNGIALDIPAGGSQTVNFDFSMGFPPNNYDLTFVVDVFDNVAELNEQNNTFSLPITVVGPAGDIDLDLHVLADPPNPDIWSSTAVEFLLTNNGDQTATGVRVLFIKPDDTKFVGGNEYTASQGTFIFGAISNTIWIVGDIPPGGSATLTLNLFMLTDEPRVAYTEVVTANEQDTDSTPNNGTPPTINEDDEAVAFINGIATPCDLTAEFQNKTCHDNGTPNDINDDTFTFDIYVVGTGTSATGWTATVGGITVNGSYGIPKNVGPYVIVDGNVPVSIFDNDTPSCQAGGLSVPPAPCSDGTPNCEIIVQSLGETCDDNGTPNDPNDDVFYVEILVTGTNTGNSGWETFTLSSQFTGTYGQAETFGPYPISGGDAIVFVRDVDFDYCNFQLNVPAPAPCSNTQCSVTANVTEVYCNDYLNTPNPDDDAYGFFVTVTGVGTGNQGWEFVGQGYAPNSNPYGASTQIGDFFINQGAVSFLIRDNEDNDCSTNITVQPPAPCSSPGTKADFFLNSMDAVEFLQGGGSEVIQPNGEVAVGSTINIFAHVAWLTSPDPAEDISFSREVRLSSDPVLDDNDLLIASADFNFNLPYNPFSNLLEEGDMGSAAIPLNTPLGDYFIIGKYDANDEVDESDETTTSRSFRSKW